MNKNEAITLLQYVRSLTMFDFVKNVNGGRSPHVVPVNVDSVTILLNQISFPKVHSAMLLDFNFENINFIPEAVWKMLMATRNVGLSHGISDTAFCYSAQYMLHDL